jgi:ABC-type uncharacterized transport system permease subunit
MGGWKTWLATIGAIITGLGLIISGLLSDLIDGNKIWEGILVILAAFGIGLGLGHKIEKIKKA